MDSGRLADDGARRQADWYGKGWEGWDGKISKAGRVGTERQHLPQHDRDAYYGTDSNSGFNDPPVRTTTLLSQRSAFHGQQVPASQRRITGTRDRHSLRQTNFRQTRGLERERAITAAGKGITV